MGRARCIAGVVLGFLCLGMRVEDVPDPRRTADGFVMDAARVLDPATAKELDGICRQLEQDTGVELAVVTVDRLEGLAVEVYARRLFDRLGLGQSWRDNGVLVLMSRDDREIRVEVGAGLLQVLTDDKAGALLDQHAIPRFKAGQTPAGLLDLARGLAIALKDARAQGLIHAEAGQAQPAGADGGPAAEVDSSAPATPVAAPPTAAEPARDTWAEARREEQLLGGLALGAGMAAFGLVGAGLLSLIVLLRHTRAGKRKTLGRGVLFPVLLWGGAVAGGIAVGVETDDATWPVGVGLGAGGVLTTLHFLLRRRLRRHLESYRRPCGKCQARMDLVDEQADDALLSTEEQAEERIGGADWEIWNCPGCGAQEKIEVSLGGASRCKKCKRRTLIVKRTTLRAATYDHGGEVLVTETCHNPNCRHHASHTHTTARLTRPSSSSGGTRSSSSSSSRSSSSSSSSSSGSGGGRSGGGGASRKW